MKARVTAYKGNLLCELLVDKSSEDVASSIDRPGNLGQVIMKTLENLGVSEEALTLMGTIKKGRDDIGDVDWFRSGNSGHVFAWFGAPKRIIHVETAVAASGFRVYREECIIIPNDVPEEAKKAIDKQ